MFIKRMFYVNIFMFMYNLAALHFTVGNPVPL